MGHGSLAARGDIPQPRRKVHDAEASSGAIPLTTLSPRLWC